MEARPSSDCISQSQAAILCGVSPATLDCFIETGYLRVERQDVGGRLLSRKELSRVFGIALRAEPQPEPPQAERRSAIRKLGSHTIEVTQEATSDEPLDYHHSDVELPAVEKLEKSIEGGGKYSPPITLEQELSKLKTIVEVQEQALQHRDEQIHDLRRERDWLKERVERMEQAAQRDQLLLLAEKESVRRLISYQQRSPLRATLQWLGLVEGVHKD